MPNTKHLPSSWAEAVDLPEDGDGVARGGDDGGLLHDALHELVHGVLAGQLGRGDVEAHLIQDHGSVVILSETIVVSAFNTTASQQLVPMRCVEITTL